MECLRRVVLLGIVVFVFLNTAGQVVTTFLFSSFFLVVMLILDPYANQWDAWLAVLGHVIVSMSMFIALLQKADVAKDDMFSQDVFAGVLVAANCLMILAVGAEACGLCFLSVQEVAHPIKPSTHGQGITGSSEGVTAFDFPDEKEPRDEPPEPPGYSFYAQRAPA